MRKKQWAIEHVNLHLGLKSSGFDASSELSSLPPSNTACADSGQLASASSGYADTDLPSKFADWFGSGIIIIIIIINNVLI